MVSFRLSCWETQRGTERGVYWGISQQGGENRKDRNPLSVKNEKDRTNDGNDGEDAENEGNDEKEHREPQNGPQHRPDDRENGSNQQTHHNGMIVWMETGNAAWAKGAKENQANDSMDDGVGQKPTDDGIDVVGDMND